MANRRPLILDAGRMKQLQDGDYIDPSLIDISALEVDVIEQTNSNAAAIVIGAPVYNDGAGTVDLAQADALATVEVLGLVKDTSIAIAGAGYIQTDGVLEATTGEWDAVTGGTGGLTAGSVYYLDPDTPGMLTTTAPSTVGDFVVRIGKAISTTQMEITIDQPIEL